MKFGLIANITREGVRESVLSFVEWAEKNSHQLVLCDDIKEVTGNSLAYASCETVADGVDILVSAGGDGTLLASARAVGDRGTPILGINLGSLGFLTQVPSQRLIEALNAIVAGRHLIQKRMLLQAEIIGDKQLESPYALNDVVIDNGPVSRIVDINLSVNGELIVTYKADGLVISTPTGSTAYSLAVGGPIVHPEMEAIIAAPISSFSLNTRPMIFNANDEIEVQVQSSHKHAGITLDGQISVVLDNSDRVRIRKAPFATNFIIFKETSFYKVLRSKLHWGIQPMSREGKERRHGL